MALVSLRVEVPAYSHSFVVSIPLSSTILEVKQEIFRSCVGEPHVNGQRIVWRGRYLGDEEKVEDIWKSSDDPRVIHLVVRSDAWSSRPPSALDPPGQSPPLPSLVSSPPTSFQSLAQALPPRGYQGSPTPPLVQEQMNPTLPYVFFKHRNAILALTTGRTISAMDPNDLEASRLWAIQVVERHGWSWPDILDKEFPTLTEDSPPGLKYERVTLGGHSYLNLRTPAEKPNVLQVHALKVLTYTFPLLSIPVPNPVPQTVSTSQTQGLPPNVNQILQQLGLPQLRVVPNQHQNPPQNRFILPDLRDLPLRPLLAPFITLAIRTLLLLYFVSPVRKPVFGLIILAWVLYELGWGNVREAFVEGFRQRQPQQQRNGAAPAPAPRAMANGPAGPAREPAQQQPAAGQTPQTPRTQNQVQTLIDNVATLNLATESETIRPRNGAPPPEEPHFTHKLTTFCGLFLITLHPAVWNRRRVALRQREGRLRTEENARERGPSADGDSPQNNETQALHHAELNAQYERRPSWVREYVERVRRGDWGDD